jgi:cytochrome c oxidase accessory protein FixG
VVTYESWRGERRGKRKHDDDAKISYGDCIDCGACVMACPTGIDIRDGIQLECISCGLCVDACNHVMKKTGQPLWLIRWDTLSNQAARARGQAAPLRLLRARTVIYLGALLLAALVMTAALTRRADVELSVQHDRAPLFVRTPDGQLRNGYTIKISNKSPRIMNFELGLIGLATGSMMLAGEQATSAQQLALAVAADSIATFRVFVSGAPGPLVDGSQRIDFTLLRTSNGERIISKSVFMGPIGGGNNSK